MHVIRKPLLVQLMESHLFIVDLVQEIEVRELSVGQLAILYRARNVSAPKILMLGLEGPELKDLCHVLRMHLHDLLSEWVN